MAWMMFFAVLMQRCASHRLQQQAGQCATKMGSWPAELRADVEFRDGPYAGTVLYFNKYDATAAEECSKSKFSSSVSRWLPERNPYAKVELELKCVASEGLIWTLRQGPSDEGMTCPYSSCSSLEAIATAFNLELVDPYIQPRGSCALLCQVPEPHHPLFGFSERLCDRHRVHSDIDPKGNLTVAYRGEELFVEGSVLSKDLPSNIRASSEDTPLEGYDYVFHMGCMPAQCRQGLLNTLSLLKPGGRLIVNPSLDGMDALLQSVLAVGFKEDDAFAAEGKLFASPVMDFPSVFVAPENISAELPEESEQLHGLCSSWA